MWWVWAACQLNRRDCLFIEAFWCWETTTQFCQTTRKTGDLKTKPRFRILLEVPRTYLLTGLEKLQIFQRPILQGSDIWTETSWSPGNKWNLILYRKINTQRRPSWYCTLQSVREIPIRNMWLLNLAAKRETPMKGSFSRRCFRLGNRHHSLAPSKSKERWRKILEKWVHWENYDRELISGGEIESYYNEFL